MMSDAIRLFPQQFLYQPEIVGDFHAKNYTRFVVVGMGGSHLAADALERLRPDIDLLVYSDYGLPVILDPKNTLIILSSYSGGTEEVLAVSEEGLKRGYNMAAIAIGGQLLDFARAHQIPFIQLPNTGIQPRSAWAYSLRALMKLLGCEADLVAMENLTNLAINDLEKSGKSLAKQLFKRVPIIYASRQNKSIAYNWKIKCNETGKIPAFYNILPELNHNEMNGFDVAEPTRELSERFTFIFLRDDDDHPQIQKRFTVLKKLYEARGLPVIEINLIGQSAIEKMAWALVLADWTAVAIAEQYGLESEQVPMVEEFKRLISK
ncbi:MAG: hypothetical protein A2821_04485 [Candidatus Magasanikbacteria bacterium RIFCSPHIGHO2_01_FULL_41_23]|uniref:SIS domain-containing protein n=1 Tax=Candidatus Magasanikbacteria bacterium RIFCSPLOWO2_01_FULL_40_15 TaxID=1798686 RepID=A0A1F6N4W7_9BACT|nr:MAG: hypothetical protein A2821_04485 [Candidatus Magasanikbacteria bacterium RIFCSPHIGHO2_01_FULL_41_23]OGH67183.1 MAG: hypothetical protein A3C66_02800 [Candidatus Magasanikbacteria bacterium RIFCSPHIGHO2_02_FULL_41_35]OGH75452.1 MAG: hypothetical protein A3F22_01345 [Candidatus Magasanikbacteria bacterium RIFCSPHIGHO2_12_FULL_41_16]OGH78720.1 MAG: hypothetical protein A2983_04440 [Candidatus Magasanikbacteria bacterium RIFCSPLOWO2_01_FULL_40_15]